MVSNVRVLRGDAMPSEKDRPRPAPPERRVLSRFGYAISITAALDHLTITGNDCAFKSSDTKS
jgi:hypothetical protein